MIGLGTDLWMRMHMHCNMFVQVEAIGPARSLVIVDFGYASVQGLQLQGLVGKPFLLMGKT